MEMGLKQATMSKLNHFGVMCRIMFPATAVIMFLIMVATPNVSAASLTPLTSIQAPASGQMISGTVSGTAVNAAGILRVDIYVYDSKGKATPIGTTTVSGATGGNYSASVNDKALPAGSYTLAVAGIGNDNKATWASEPVQIGPAPTTSISSPASGATEGGAFQLSGKVTNHAGVAQVDAYAYNSQGQPIYLGTDSSGSGSYNIQVGANALKAGTYTLAVAGIGKDGDVCWSTTPIRVYPAAATTVSSPADGAVKNGTFTVSGQAANHSGIARVDIYAFNSQGKPTYLNSGNVSGATGGNYGVQVNATSLPAGNYMLAVAGIGNDGDVVWATRNITVGPAATTSIAAPASGAAITGGSFILSGTVQNHSGIKQVDAYAYNSQGKPIYIGTDSGSNGSYSISADTGALKAGSYTLAVAGIGNDGDVAWAIRNITVGPAATATITAPANGAVESGSFTVTGQASNHSGVGRIDVYAYDGQGRPTYIGTGSATGNSYTATADVSKLPAGQYTLAVAAIGNDQDTVWATRSLIVGSAAVTTINTPGDGATVSRDLTVEGWALSHAGVGRVDIYLYDSNHDPHFIGSVDGSQLQHTTATQSTYPQYGSNPQCDYTITYNMSQIGTGTYTLAVANIGNDQDVVWATKNITYAYNISLSQMEADHPGVDSTALDPAKLYNHNSVSKYEFMSLNWVDGVTADDLNNMLNGCGSLAGHGQDFLDAAKTYDINPVYLVAHAKLETGNGDTDPDNPSYLCRGIVFQNGVENYRTLTGRLTPVNDTNGNPVTGTLVSGTTDTYTYTDPHGNKYNVKDGTYYNLWGIHGYDPIASWGGGIWAGYNNWSSIRAAIFGGSKWIAQYYTTGTHYAQNTLYEMKWDPYGWSINDPAEYATDYNSLTDNWAYHVAQGIQKYASIFGHTTALFFHTEQYSD